MRTIVPGVRTTVLIFAFLAISLFSNAQSIMSYDGRYEIGLGLGPMLFLGDLGGNYGRGTTFLKDANIPVTKFAKGIYFSVYPSEFIGLRLNLNHGKLEGDDALAPDNGGDEYYRRLRNLNFQSSVTEFYGAIELYPTVPFERYDGLQGKFRPYGVAGIGAFKFNPKGQYYSSNGTYQWVELKPLRLEGQGMAEYPDRKPYSLISLEIPMGVGFKYYIKDNMYVGLEVLHRKTFTDYVDDVSTNYIDGNLFAAYLSPEQAQMARQMHFREGYVKGQPAPVTRPLLNEQRGDPTEMDSYFSTVLRFGWRLNNWNSPNGRALRQLRCPSYY